jgi:hypothetical protein
MKTIRLTALLALIALAACADPVTAPVQPEVEASMAGQGLAGGGT